MKKLSFLLATNILLNITVKAQITITPADMPQAGDDFIITNAAVDLTIDPEITGANHNWDFQNITPLTSNPDTFTDESGLPVVYQLFFFGSNLAEKTGYSVSFSSFTLDDVYNVYKTSSSSFKQTGYAGTLDGIPIPLVYNDEDVIYALPIQYGDIDSSNSNFTFSLPGFAYISQQRKRINHADGWGMVTTPIGTFNALRVKSTIIDNDSVFLDTLSFGTAVTITSYEYKWLAQGEGIPVFQINAQDVLGTPVVTQMLYQDTTFHTGVQEAVGTTEKFLLFPNPAKDYLQIQWVDYSKKSLPLVITDVTGRIFYEGNFTASLLAVDISAWPNGIYIASIFDDKEGYCSKVVVQH